MAFPFYLMLITAFKQTRDLLNPKNNPFVFNMPPTLDHVRVLFTDTMFAQWLLNTAMVGVLVVGITLLLAVPAGYSLARLTGRLGEQLGIAIFLTYLVPQTCRSFPFPGRFPRPNCRIRCCQLCCCMRALPYRFVPGC